MCAIRRMMSPLAVMIEDRRRGRVGDISQKFRSGPAVLEIPTGHPKVTVNR